MNADRAPQLKADVRHLHYSMPIVANGNETYLWLTGLSTSTPVPLGPHTELLPANCQLSPKDLVGMVKHPSEYAVALLVVPLVRSQLCLRADSAKQLAIVGWNAQWECLLLSALFDKNILWNLQSDIPVDEIRADASLNTNWLLAGVHLDSTHHLTEEDDRWLRTHFQTATTLLGNVAFQTAVHSLASFHWHSHPRVRLALIWAGIESIFGIDSELVFRVSLYTARFLAPNDETERLEIFANVKRLYKQRSAAVHGSAMKGDTQDAVNESSLLLRRLVRRCIENNGLPVLESLAP